MKPNFIVIGAQKCGTTTLCRELERHPEVGLFPHKETHFFSFRYDRGLDWYERLFDKLDGRVIGEGSPSYTTGEFSKLAAQRIGADLPDVKLIFIARHPLERLPSGYTQLFDSGLNPGSFEEELRRSPKLIPASCYHARLNDFYEHIPRSAIHVMFLEDLKLDYEGEMARMFEFLGVSTETTARAPLAPQNTRADKSADRRLLKSARKSRFFLPLSWNLPRKIKGLLKAGLRNKLRVEVNWTPELRKYATEKIRDDAELFLEANGKPRDFWSWD